MSLYHPVHIGSLALGGNLFLAPVAGYSDRAFRSICRECGADFAYTEMVSAEALTRGSGKTEELMRRAPNEAAYAVQLFGGRAETMADAARLVLARTSAECIDINCGCPVPKIVKTGAGSALTREPEKLYAVVKAVVAAVNAYNGARPARDAAAADGDSARVAAVHADAANSGMISADSCPPHAATFYASDDSNAASGNIAHNSTYDANTASGSVHTAASSMAPASAFHADAADGSMNGADSRTPHAAAPYASSANSSIVAPTSRPAPAAAARAAPVPVTVKIRSGWDSEHITWKEAAQAALEAGAAAITLHARTRAQGYEGKADWRLLAELVQFVGGRVPVFGSGDAFTPQDAARMLTETGCDGVMFARGAMGNPFLFTQTREFLQTGAVSDIPAAARISAGFRELELLIADRGEKSACLEMRKRFCAYSRGIAGSSALRKLLVAASTRAEFEAAFAQFLPQ